MKKKLKSKKVWIIVAFVAVFLVTCGIAVYAANGFSDYKKTSDDQGLTKSNWNSVMDKIDSLDMWN